MIRLFSSMQSLLHVKDGRIVSIMYFLASNGIDLHPHMLFMNLVVSKKHKNSNEYIIFKIIIFVNHLPNVLTNLVAVELNINVCYGIQRILNGVEIEHNFSSPCSCSVLNFDSKNWQLNVRSLSRVLCRNKMHDFIWRLFYIHIMKSWGRVCSLNRIQNSKNCLRGRCEKEKGKEWNEIWNVYWIERLFIATWLNFRWLSLMQKKFSQFTWRIS